jgi:hypothetical protein
VCIASGLFLAHAWRAKAGQEKTIDAWIGLGLLLTVCTVIVAFQTRKCVRLVYGFVTFAGRQVKAPGRKGESSIYG